MLLSVKWGEKHFCSPKHFEILRGDIKKMCDVLNGRYGDLQNINQIETTPVVTP